MTGAGAPFHATAERVTASLFSVLSVGPLLGRTFTQKEDENAVPVTVISYALWRERFHGDPGVLGRTIDLDRRPLRDCRSDATELRIPTGRRPLEPSRSLGSDELYSGRKGTLKGKTTITVLWRA